MNIGQWIVLLVTLHRNCYGSQTLSPRQSGLMNFVNKFAYTHNPEGGYEPYWADGEAVIRDETLILLSPGGKTNIAVTTTKLPYPMVCGVPCLDSYRSIKHVCTHHTNSNQMKGCMYHPLKQRYKNVHCWNTIPDTFDNPFHEFESYCDYQAATCGDHFTAPRYILLHIGKCKDEHFWFKDLIDYKNVIQRLTGYPLFVLSTKPVGGKGKRRSTTEDPLLKLLVTPASK